MAFDLPTLVRFVFIPAVIALLGAGVAIALRHKQPAEAANADNPLAMHPLTTALVSFAWALAVAEGILAADGWALWPESPWARITLPLFVAAIAASPLVHGLVHQVWYGWIAVIAAWLVMPAGEGWDDMLSMHRSWMAAFIIAATANAYLLHQMAARSATRWLPCVLLAALGIAAVIGAASFSDLFHACLAAICATFVMGLFAALGRLPQSTGLVWPGMLFCAAMIAAGRFYSYAEVPAYAYGVALVSPSLIAIADWLLSTRTVWIRVAAAAIVAAILIGLTIFWFLIS